MREVRGARPESLNRSGSESVDRAHALRLQQARIRQRLGHALNFSRVQGTVQNMQTCFRSPGKAPVQRRESREPGAVTQ